MDDQIEHAFKITIPQVSTNSIVERNNNKNNLIKEGFKGLLRMQILGVCC